MKKTFLFIFLCCISVAQAQDYNKEMITAFGQGTVQKDKKMARCIRDQIWGNCASVAVIKAALAQFGSLDSIYQKIEKTSSGSTNIVFWDGVAITILNTEIDTIKNMAKFECTDTSNAYYQNAMFLYASMAKRVLEAKSTAFPKDADCIVDFSKAVMYLNSGFSTKDAHWLLGMQKDSIKDLSTVKDYDALVVWSNYHAVFCSKGHQDWFGEDSTIENNKIKGANNSSSKIIGAYRLRKQ